MDGKRTSKSCPGCGYQPNMGYRSRPLFRNVDGVCQDCEKTLAEHRAFVEALESLPGWKTYTMSPQWFHQVVEGMGRWELADQINKALDDLVSALLPVNTAATKALREAWNEPDIPSTRLQHSRVAGGRRFFLPEGAPEVLETCRKLLAEALLQNYQHGLQEGLDLVRGLQAGELTNAEFVRLGAKGLDRESE